MSERHHEYPDTYADTWEDCLVVGEGSIENPATAGYWGGKAGDTMVSLCDCTDGPVTRVRFLVSDGAAKDAFPEGSRFRLKPNDKGEFVVDRYEEGRGASDCVVMTMPDITIANAAGVEKWVPRERIPELFPVGRRFGLERVKEEAAW